MRDFRLLSGLRVSEVDGAEVLARCELALAEGRPFHICTVNPEIHELARVDGEYAAAVEAADLRTLDGIGLSLAIWGGHRRFPRRMTGVQLVDLLAGWAAETGRTLRIVGAHPSSRERAEERLRARGVDVAPGCSPVVDTRGREADPCGDSLPRGGVVLVALGAPKQELWIRRRIEHGAQAGVFVGVGGAVDYLSGAARPSPRWVRAAGLEWLDRLRREPRLRGHRQRAALVSFMRREVFPAFAGRRRRVERDSGRARTRVVVFHNIVAPYRHGLFRELARRVDLDVLYSARTTPDRSWPTDASDDYRSTVLPSCQLHAWRRTLIVGPGAVREVRRRRPRAVIAVLARSNLLDTLRICAWGRRARVPVLLWVGDVERHGFDDGLPGFVRRLSATYWRRALRSASGYLYYSERSRRWAERRGARGPFLVGTQVLDRSGIEPRLRTGDRNGRVVGLFVGKLDARKGVDRLIEALPRLAPDVRDRLDLKLVGAGPLAADLGGIAGVEYAGPRPRDALWEEYRAADFLVVPSRHDPWGFVANEAMEVGTPVLATRQAGCAELAARAGWVCDLRVPGDLERALEVAVRTCRERGRRKRAADAVEEYRPDACAERVASLLAEVSRR